MRKEYLNVPNKQVLEMLKNNVEDEIAYVESIDQYFIYDNGEWIPYHDEECLNVESKSDTEMNLYAFNKIIINQMPDYTDEEIEQSKKVIRNYIDMSGSSVYMLLNNELRYYTVFILDKENSDEKIEDIVIECLKYYGSIKSVELNEETNAIEIWFNHEEESYVAYLFNYEEGVIVCQ